MSVGVSVDVQVASAVASVPDESEINSWVLGVIREIGFERQCEVSIRIVDEAEGRALNKEYRDVDKATNVLSFPSDLAALAKIAPDIPFALGDIVICGPIVEQEAAIQRKTLAAHWAHLLVHGMLHLLGYDHEEDDEAQAMEKIETRILEQRGIADPYAA